MYAAEINRQEAADRYISCAAKTSMITVMAEKAGYKFETDKRDSLKKLTGLYMEIGKALTTNKDMIKEYTRKTMSLAYEIKDASDQNKVPEILARVGSDVEKCAETLEKEIEDLAPFLESENG